MLGTARCFYGVLFLHNPWLFFIIMHPFLHHLSM